MRESSQIVRIERHRVAADVVALTFTDPDRGTAAGHPPFLVFVLHGLGSRKERHLDLCLRLAGAGFVACAIDAVGHGDRATPEARRRLADINAPEFLPAFTETVTGTVQDVAAAATYFGATAYGLVGHSMGGFIGLHTALADPRVTGLVCISGAIDLSVADDPNFPEEAREKVRAIDPVHHANGFWPRPVLILHGDADEMVPVQGARRLHAALQPLYAKRPDILRLEEYPGVGHELLPEMSAEAVEWARRYLPRAV